MLVWKTASRTPARPDFRRTASRQEQPYPRTLFRSPGSETSALVAAGQAPPGVACAWPDVSGPCRDALSNHPLSASALLAARSMSLWQEMAGQARSCWCRRQLVLRWTKMSRARFPRWWWPAPATTPLLAGLRWWTPGSQLPTLRPPDGWSMPPSPPRLQASVALAVRCCSSTAGWLPVLRAVRSHACLRSSGSTPMLPAPRAPAARQDDRHVRAQVFRLQRPRAPSEQRIPDRRTRGFLAADR